MKRTIKMLIVSALLSTTQATPLTLKQIETLYSDAIHQHAGETFTKVAQLQLSYANALRKHRAELVKARDAKNVSIIAAIDEEIALLDKSQGGNLPEISAKADREMKVLRAKFSAGVKAIAKDSDEKGIKLQNTLVEQLKKLKQRLVKEGKVDEAVLVHKKLGKFDLEPKEETYEESAKDLSFGLIKGDSAYTSGITTQVVQLKKGVTYIFSCKIITDSGTIDKHDLLPSFRPLDQETFHAGTDWDAYKSIEENRAYEMTKKGFGWNNLRTTFKSEVDMKLRLAFQSYQNNQVYLKDCHLATTEEPTVNLITKNLYKASSWTESEHVTLAKGVNRAGK